MERKPEKFEWTELNKKVLLSAILCIFFGTGLSILLFYFWELDEVIFYLAWILLVGGIIMSIILARDVGKQKKEWADKQKNTIDSQKKTQLDDDRYR